MASLADLKPPHKVLAYAEYGAGKTSLALTLIPYLRDSLKLKPEQVRIGIIDNDDGIRELIEAGLVDPDWLQCFDYNVCHDWTSLTKTTDRLIPELKAWQAKNGLMSAWLIVDNMGLPWAWARDQYAMDTWGKTENERAIEVRQEMVQAGTPKQFAPVFDGRKDYPPITGMHARWADPIKLSNLNFIWLAPLSAFKQDEATEEVIKAKGQKDNEGRVSHILQLYTEEVMELGVPVLKYFAKLEKNRGGTTLFKKMPDPTYSKFRRWVEANSPAALAIKAREAAAKAAAATQASAQTTAAAAPSPASQPAPAPSGGAA